MLTAMSRPLEDKVVVIVGGTTGLGLAGAQACVRAGARVVVVGRSAESARKALEVLGDRARAVVGDASRPETVREAMDLAARELGPIAALYHVAGGSGRKAGDGPLHEVTDEGWEETLRANLTSLFHSNRAAARRFLEQGTPGSVLNMTSVLAFSPSPRHFATHAYAAAKAAAIGLTVASAAYYAPRGIRFNAVAPAVIETPMAARAAGDAEIREFLEAKQPLQGGLGRPEDLDAAVVFFLSDQSRHVTGQVLAVDGGWCVSEGLGARREPAP
ncbi:MAG: SDR family oxidoreductase [Planctomycetes bacterium]|nr:SDR family oxidoreductase [Planctomycetota bacterium]